jgi:hypothetical protein
MLTLKDFLLATDYRVSELYNYQWQSYGDRAANMSYVAGDLASISSSVSIVYDLRTNEAYEMQAWDAVNNREYRWFNPAYKEAHEQEAKRRGVDTKQSYDNNKFIDLEVEEDIIEKVTAISRGLPYDEGVLIPLDMTDAEFMTVALAAHKANMTLNAYMNNILAEIVKQEKAKPSIKPKKKACKKSCKGCNCG